VSLGLDLGSTEFRSIRRVQGRMVGRACATAIAIIDETPVNRERLAQERIIPTRSDAGLIVFGPDAAIISERLSVPLQPLLPEGLIPTHDAAALQCLATIFDAVLPPARIAGEICSMTIPGELLPAKSSPERQFFSELARRRGYESHFVGQGTAVALAELGDAGFNGVGISLGATQCEFALMVHGQERGRCAIPWGTSELGQQLDIPVSRRRQSAATTSAPSRPEQMIVEFLTELLLEAGTRIGQQDGFSVLSQPVSLVCAGGLSQREGFPDLLNEAWSRAGWPLDLRTLRVASDPIFTAARGCLVHAKLEAEAVSYQRAAA
jgi:hypothetical protein